MTHEQMSALAEIFRINNRAKWRLSYFKEFTASDDSVSFVSYIVKYKLDEYQEDAYIVNGLGNYTKVPK